MIVALIVADPIDRRIDRRDCKGFGEAEAVNLSRFTFHLSRLTINPLLIAPYALPFLIMFRSLLLTTLMFLTAGASAAPIASPEPELKARLIQAMTESSDSFDRFDAEVWLTDFSMRLSGRINDEKKRLELLKQVYIEASRVDLPPELVLAVIQIESNFDRFAISEAGARGLMQIMPFWLDEIGRPEDNLFQTDTNLRFGCTILRYYLDMEKGDLGSALARYNGSIGSTRYSSKVVVALHKQWYRK